MSTQKKHAQRNYIPSARGNARKAVDETRFYAYNCRIDGHKGENFARAPSSGEPSGLSREQNKKELYPYESCKYESAPLPSLRKGG